MVSKSIKLLVADDHRLFIEGLRMVLKEELNIQITDTAFNGRQAIDRCLAEKFDVVLMDINMPVINGIEATQEIKRLRPDVKVIIVSMNTDYATVNKAIKAGADGYILKSEGAEEIEKALKSVLKNEVYLSKILSDTMTKDGDGRIASREDLLHFSESLITTREQGVLKLVAEGFTNQQIADTLHISVRTVDTHRTNMLTKLKLPNTAALVKFAVENKLV
ncbi:MAG: response regulator transcription factor [Bacteroidetes bacterium]|nr:response regulator transcription factor [Bacteroidota bacterium]